MQKSGRLTITPVRSLSVSQQFTQAEVTSLLSGIDTHGRSPFLGGFMEALWSNVKRAGGGWEWEGGSRKGERSARSGQQVSRVV